MTSRVNIEGGYGIGFGKSAARTGSVLLAIAGAAFVAQADVSNYDDLTEGFQGAGFTYGNVMYWNANNVSGVFPDGSTFVPADLGDQFIVENATLLYNDFPTWGSGPNALTFGSAFIPGNNLSLGAFAKADLSFAENVGSISFDMAFYENGPWGGIVFYLDGIRNGNVVSRHTLTIADGGGRDNIAFGELSVSGEFDSARIYAKFGDSYSAPRLMIDNLTLTPVPAPGVLAIALGGLVMVRRRR